MEAKPGKKSAKTETLAVRIDAKEKYGLEILSRMQRRSLTSLVEYTINQKLREYLVITEPQQSALFKDKVYEEGCVLDDIWSDDEVMRLILLLDFAPQLLTFEEGLVWKLIQDNAIYWTGRLHEKESKYIWNTSDLSTLRIDFVRHDFDKLKNYALGRVEVIDSMWYLDGEPLRETLPSVLATGLGSNNPDERTYLINEQDELEFIKRIQPFSAKTDPATFNESFGKWLKARLEAEERFNEIKKQPEKTKGGKKNVKKV
jgi:hypothetical protein